MPFEADVPQIASLHYVKQLCPQSVRALLQSWPQFYDEHVVIGIGTVKDTLMQLDDSYRESLQALRQQFTEQVLAPLLPKKHAVLLETLFAYCAHTRVVSTTAAALHIHQNTLYRRLQKIETLLKRDFTQADHVLEVSLAVHLYGSYAHRAEQ